MPVSSLAAARLGAAPHLEGRAFCCHCGERFDTAQPYGVMWFACPLCRTPDSAVFLSARLQPMPPDEWQCVNCKTIGRVAITPTGLVCQVCRHRS